MNEEATPARELILLFRSDLNGEFNMREVGTGKLEALGSFGFVNVDGVRLGVVTSTCLNFLKRLRVLLSYVGAEFISVSGHARSIGNASVVVEISPGSWEQAAEPDRLNQPRLLLFESLRDGMSGALS